MLIYHHGHGRNRSLDTMVEPSPTLTSKNIEKLDAFLDSNTSLAAISNDSIEKLLKKHILIAFTLLGQTLSYPYHLKRELQEQTS